MSKDKSVSGGSLTGVGWEGGREAKGPVGWVLC